MAPLVVVESNSMIHSEQGEVGSIDAGDLVLVNSPQGPIKLSRIWNQYKKEISSMATRVMACQVMS